jgi:hypothetical protein
MNDEDGQDAMHKFTGELLATQMAIRALILAHSNPKGCADDVRAMFEKCFARGLNTTLTDATLDGMRNAIATLLPFSRDVAEAAAR